MSAPTGLYRHQTKTPGSYPIGLDFVLDMGGFYEALRAPKRDTLFLLNHKTRFGLKTRTEPTGQAREDLPIYKLDLPDPIFRVPELKQRHLRPKHLKI